MEKKSSFLEFYYNDRLNEELDDMDQVRQEVGEENIKDMVHDETPICSKLLNKYIKSGNGDLKDTLGALANDIGEAVLKFANNDYAKQEDFASDDIYLKYKEAVRSKIELGLVKQFVELFKNIGVQLENDKRSLRK